MRSEGFSFYIWGSGGWPVFAWPCFWRPQPSATVRNRLQPSVCDRRGRKVAVPMGKVAKTWLFWRVRSCGHVVLRGRRGTSWHSNMFQDASKIVLCGRRNFATFSEDVLHFAWQAQHLKVILCGRRITFATFSEDVLLFLWQAQHFRHLRCHFAWQAQHLNIVLCGRRNTFATFSKDVLLFLWQAQHFGHLRCHLRGRRRTFDLSCCMFSANRIVSPARRGDEVQIPWQA